MCRCFVLVQLPLNLFHVDVRLNLDDVLLVVILRFVVSDVVLLDTILEHFDVCDVLLLDSSSCSFYFPSSSPSWGL